MSKRQCNMSFDTCFWTRNVLHDLQRAPALQTRCIFWPQKLKICPHTLEKCQCLCISGCEQPNENNLRSVHCHLSKHHQLDPKWSIRCLPLKNLRSTQESHWHKRQLTQPEKKQNLADTQKITGINIDLEVPCLVARECETHGSVL